MIAVLAAAQAGTITRMSIAVRRLAGTVAGGRITRVSGSIAAVTPVITIAVSAGNLAGIITATLPADLSLAAGADPKNPLP